MTPEEALKAGIPESVHDWNEVGESKDPNSFWDQMKNMRSRLGVSITKPGEDAGAEDWGKFSNKVVEISDGRLIPNPANSDDPDQMAALNRALGVPDDPTDYEFAEIEGSKLDDQRAEFARKVAKDVGLTKKQLKVLDQKYREKEVESYNAQLDEFNNGLKELNQEWGLAAEDRIHAAKKVQKAFFPHIPEDTPLSANELKAFYSLYSQLNTDKKEFQDQENQQTSGMSVADAQGKIDEIMNNKDHPYHNVAAPGYQAAKAKVRKLYKIKNGITD